MRSRSLTYMIGVADEHRKFLFSPIATMLALLLIVGLCSRAHADCGVPRFLSGSALKAEVSAALAKSAAQPQVSGSDSRVYGHGNGRDPIVGLWQITATDDNGNIVDHVLAGWTGDGLEFDQDISPILTGYVCYGTWVKLGHNTYGLTHPFFDFMDPNVNGEGDETTEGQWDGNSGYFNYTVTVSNHGRTFTGKEVVKIVQGPDPYDPNAAVLFTGNFNLSATKVAVDRSLLP